MNFEKVEEKENGARERTGLSTGLELEGPELYLKVLCWILLSDTSNKSK